MKLRNKKTGEIGYLIVGRDSDHYVVAKNVWNSYNEYNSLAELNEEWEDYEEPKGTALYWMILTLENFIENEPDDKWVGLEDCKQMSEKLKAWERLKDKGFEFIGKTYETDKRFGSIFYKVDEDTYSEDIINDLDLLFGGER